MSWIVANLWLVPALPLLAAGLSALAKRPSRTWAASLAIGSMGLGFLLSCAALVETLDQPSAHLVRSFDWFVLGETTFKLGWVLDPLTASMLVMITLVGTLIFVFSVGYMEHDQNFTRFFCFLSLFAAAMLGLVIANNLLMLFMCWELVGLASYLLIGFWYHKPSAAAAAKKAFITTRIGDLGFLLGLLWLYAACGTLLFYDGGAGCLEKTALTKLVGQVTLGGMAASTAISLLLFCGAIGKSGQVPLHVWLPDAMEGPTPVSALIHAATMVAAGVFLVARVYPLMAAAPAGTAGAAPVVMSANANATGQGMEPGRGSTAPAAAGREETAKTAKAAEAALEKTKPAELAETSHAKEANQAPRESTAEISRRHGTAAMSAALTVVTWIGAITAVFAALIAVTQTDLKRILAYSTVSQLGYMFVGLGVGGVAVGIFHLLTHAFFKALLFLGAGSVIHGSHEEQDIRRMGGLRRSMPVTFVTYAIGMMALAGVPLLFSGFWSKDEILHGAWVWQPSKWPFVLTAFGALLTAFYMTRQVVWVFFGPSRAAHKAHESPAVMTVPLAILAVFSVLLGALGTPIFPWFQTYLAGHTTAVESTVEVGVLLTMLFSTVVVTAGLALGWWLYGRQPLLDPVEPDPLERWRPDWFGVLQRKFFIDELYDVSVVRFNDWSARTARWLDDIIWSGAVTAVSYLVLGLSWVNRLVDEFVVNLWFDRSCGLVGWCARLVGLWQNGQVQRYLRALALSLALGGLLFIWGCR